MPLALASPGPAASHVIQWFFGCRQYSGKHFPVTFIKFHPLSFFLDASLCWQCSVKPGIPDARNSCFLPLLVFLTIHTGAAQAVLSSHLNPEGIRLERT